MNWPHPIALSLALTVPLTAVAAESRNSHSASAPSSNIQRLADGDEQAAPEQVVTDADNGAQVTLETGNVLVVRLKSNPSTGYSWANVNFANMPLRLISHRLLSQTNEGAPVVGAPKIEEWKFAAAGKATNARTVWLKFLYLRPFQKGIEGANVWEIKVTVPAS